MSFRRRLALMVDPTIEGDFLEYRGSFDAPAGAIENLIREQLGGIIVTHEASGSLLDGMTKEQEIDFCEKATDVLKNPTFLQTVHHLIAQQVDYTVKRASSMDEVLFGRATVNGLSLLKEQFEVFAARAEELRKVEEKFEPSEVI